MSICSTTSRTSSAAGCRFAERIQVHGDQVDGADAVGGDGRHVFGQVATREQSAVHRRVQRLHPPVQHFGEIRQRFDVADRETGGAQGACGASVETRIPPIATSSGRSRDSGLVIDREEAVGI
jgi:hypothetical protein